MTGANSRPADANVQLETATGANWTFAAVVAHNVHPGDDAESRWTFAAIVAVNVQALAGPRHGWTSACCAGRARKLRAVNCVACNR
ncbi:MAG: hypothetical protein ACLP50_33630 [Solirubrobacteraceae bacterium]